MKTKLLGVLVCLAALTQAVFANGGAQTGSQGSSQPAATSSGSAGGKDYTLTVTYLGNGNNKAVLDKGLAIFTQQTGLKATQVFVPGSWADYFTKLQTMVAGGQSPDCACVAIEGFQMLMSTGMARPMDDWIAAHKTEWDAVTSDIDPMVMDFMKFDGKQYGAANEWNNVVTHFNTKLLKEAGLSLPPANWNKDQFLEYAQKLTKKRADGTMQYGCFVPNYYFGFQSWLYNDDTAYLTPDMKKSTLLDPKTVEMFQFMQDLVYKYKVAPIPQPGLDYVEALVRGDVAMNWAGRWPTNNYVLDKFNDVAVQYTPNFRKNVTVWGGTGVFTMKDTKHFEDAAKLSLFLCSKPWVNTVMQYGAIPVLKSVAAEVVPKLGIPDNYQVYFKNAPEIKAVQAPATYAQVANCVERAMSDILVNDKDVMTTLKAADAELNSILMD
jgi:ABC-type glycerol-3-phosphate transport system substrate-binding protein